MIKMEGNLGAWEFDPAGSSILASTFPRSIKSKLGASLARESAANPLADPDVERFRGAACVLPRTCIRFPPKIPLGLKGPVFGGLNIRYCDYLVGVRYKCRGEAIYPVVVH